MPTLPTFKYHPDPIATGSVVESDATCMCCEKERGYVYSGSPYAEEDLEDAICPWCIANGDAAEKFEAEFSACDFIGPSANALSEAATREVVTRTPGFASWQQEQWWTHCGDAAAFLGPMGASELAPFGEPAFRAIVEECGYDGSDLVTYMASLDKDRGPTAYLFRCLHCGEFGGFSDCH